LARPAFLEKRQSEMDAPLHLKRKNPWAGSLVCATWGINRLLKALGNCFQCSPSARAYYGNLRACSRVNECRPGNDPTKRANRGGDPLGRTVCCEMVDLPSFLPCSDAFRESWQRRHLVPILLRSEDAVMCRVHLECLVDVWKNDSLL
jgi:hypothetical protein